MPVLPRIPVTDTMTKLSDLVARTRLLLSEPVEDMWTDVEIEATLNEGAIELVTDTQALPRAFIGFETVQGAPLVRLPDDIARLVEVHISDGTKLGYLTTVEYTVLKDASGKPISFCSDFLDDSGRGVLALYPTPDATYVLEGSYFATPETMTSAVGPTWHRKYHFLPCQYAAAKLLPRDHRVVEASLYADQFDQGKTSYKKWLAARAPYREMTFAQMPKGEM